MWGVVLGHWPPPDGRLRERLPVVAGGLIPPYEQVNRSARIGRSVRFVSPVTFRERRASSCC